MILLENKTPDLTLQGRIQNYLWGGGGSIWSNVRTYPTYLERQANSVDTDQTPENAASHLGPHCFPIILQFYTVLLAGGLED